ncbi:MAG: NADPH-dependent F420 reductase [Myxococcales bacterium]
MAKQRIGVLGTGDVGRVLATGFVEAGHEVMLGSRDAKNEKVTEWVAKAGPRAKGGTFADAAKFGEIVVLATLWTGTEHALELAGAKNLAGKVVMDATNPLSFGPSGPSLALGHTDSGGEQVQRWLPEAKVVKVYNTVGNAHMVHPSFPGGPPDMFICGNDDGAKKTVAELVKNFGWGVIDTGGIEGARLLEPMCLLWVGYGVRTNTWNHAFKLLRK